MVRMAFHIHKSARKGLKAKAQATGLPVAELLRRIIDDALKA